MAIYDNDGTATHEIARLYDNDGTGTHQAGTVYDNDGTANHLIYKSEFVLLDGNRPTEYTGGWFKENGNSIWWDGSGLHLATGASWFTTAQMSQTVDARGFTKAICSVYLNGWGNWGYCFIVANQGWDWRINIPNGEGWKTIVLDISHIDDLWIYAGINARDDASGWGQLIIGKIVLE